MPQWCKKTVQQWGKKTVQQWGIKTVQHRSNSGESMGLPRVGLIARPSGAAALTSDAGQSSGPLWWALVAAVGRRREKDRGSLAAWNGGSARARAARGGVLRARRALRLGRPGRGPDGDPFRGSSGREGGHVETLIFLVPASNHFMF